MNRIDVYAYIASNNPRVCRQILQDFDYVARSRDMAQNLRDLVNLEGEAAVTEIMKYHPDRDYFEASGSSKLESMFDKLEREKYAYLNATGSANIAKPMESSNQQNTIILASAVILAIAILSKK